LTISNALLKSNVKHCNISLFQKDSQSRLGPFLSRPLIFDGYIIDGSRTGRKDKVTLSLTSEFSRKSPRDRFGREKSCADVRLFCLASSSAPWISKDEVNKKALPFTRDERRFVFNLPYDISIGRLMIGRLSYRVMKLGAVLGRRKGWK
jgi:hypothetical protein